MSKALEKLLISEKRRNVEIKAQVSDLPPLIARVRSIADFGPTLIHQDDTFYLFPGVG